MGVPKLLPYVGKVSADSPAMHAGLKKGDRIVQINGKPITYWEEVGKQINANQGEITLIIERDDQRRSLTLQPKVIDDKNIFGETVSRRIIGIAPMPKQTTVIYGFADGFKYAWSETVKASTLIFKSLQKLLTGAVGTENIGGIITIVDVTAQASHAGILALFFFTALISVNLGVLNLLPIPALDGGHIMFNLYEMLTRKEPNETVMYYMTVTGWAILFGLMGLGLYNDIHRLMG